MVFPISELNLHLNDSLYYEFVNLLKDTIYETSIVYSEYVMGNHFTDRSQMSLANFRFFFTFREGKTLQSDIEALMSNFKPDILGNYKEGKLPLAQQHLNTIEHLINPQKSIHI